VVLVVSTSAEFTDDLKTSSVNSAPDSNCLDTKRHHGRAAGFLNVAEPTESTCLFLCDSADLWLEYAVKQVHVRYIGLR